MGPHVDRRHRVALEWRRQPGTHESSPGDRPIPVAMPHLILGFDDATPPRIVRPEQRELLPLTEPRRRHAEQPDLLAPDLWPGEFERRSEDRLGQVGRLL